MNKQNPFEHLQGLETLKIHGVYMKKVIIFFNGKPSKVITVLKGVTSIREEYPNGEVINLQIMSAGFPSLTGDHEVVYVASDRELTSQEILDAAQKYL